VAGQSTSTSMMKCRTAAAGELGACRDMLWAGCYDKMYNMRDCCCLHAQPQAHQTT